MSRQLPERPNLEHLKKQAKDLLGDLRTAKPDAQLADALHAIAREYGFPSWPELKARVEQGAKSPFTGRWVADLSRTTPHAANQFRSATIDISVSGDVVRFSDAVVDDAGKLERRTNAIRVDGQPLGTENGYVLSARWLGPRVIEAVATRGNEVEERGRYEISADGHTLIITARDSRIVLTRV